MSEVNHFNLGKSLGVVMLETQCTVGKPYWDGEDLVPLMCHISLEEEFGGLFKRPD